MLTCTSVVARPQSCNAARIKAGRLKPISAIVIHLLTGVGVEAYEVSMQSPLPAFHTGNINPLSVHFVVTDIYAVQYAELGNTTYGIDYLLNPSWPGLVSLLPLQDINAPFVHIAIKSESQNITGLVHLICCINESVGFELPIIAASDLQSDRPVYELNPDVIAQVALCAENGILPPPNWQDFSDDITALKTCCAENKGQIYLLQHRTKELENCVELINNRLCSAEVTIGILTTAVAQIPGLVEAVRLLQGEVQEIQENCCESTPESACFDYQLLSGQEMTTTPNQPVHLNLPTKVIDQEPPIVITGPLWRVSLQGTCTWSLNGTVRFKLNSWCANTKAQLYIVVCGQRTEIASSTVTNTGTQLVQLTFNGFLQASGCANVYLEVAINDQSAQIVTFADFSGCCV